MGSLHTEIGIMVAILVGAWAVKVAAVALYLFCHRRRLRRLAAAGEGLPTTCNSHKPTPQPVITALPVIPYADAVQQLKAAVHCSSSDINAKQASQQHAAAAAATGTATKQKESQEHLQSDVDMHCDQQLLQQQQQQQQQHTDDLRKSSASSLSAAATAVGGCGEAAAIQTAPKDPSSHLTAGGSIAEAECCPICFGEYDASDVAVKQLPCRHYFHPECIDAWLVRDNTCPLCKSLVWEPDDTEAAAVDAAGGDAVQQQLQQQRHVLRVIIIGGLQAR